MNAPSALSPLASYVIVTTIASFAVFRSLWLEIVAFDPDTAASLPTFTDTEISSHAADTKDAVITYKLDNAKVRFDNISKSRVLLTKMR